MSSLVVTRGGGRGEANTSKFTKIQKFTTI